MTTERALSILAQTFELYETEALLRAIMYGEQGNNFYLGGSIAALTNEGKLFG